MWQEQRPKPITELTIVSISTESAKRCPARHFIFIHNESKVSSIERVPEFPFVRTKPAAIGKKRRRIGLLPNRPVSDPFVRQSWEWHNARGAVGLTCLCARRKRAFPFSSLPGTHLFFSPPNSSQIALPLAGLCNNSLRRELAFPAKPNGRKGKLDYCAVSLILRSAEERRDYEFQVFRTATLKIMIQFSIVASQIRSSQWFRD